jgi:hypothetical protein
MATPIERGSGTRAESDSACIVHLRVLDMTHRCCGAAVRWKLSVVGEGRGRKLYKLPFIDTLRLATVPRAQLAVSAVLYVSDLIRGCQSASLDSNRGPIGLATRLVAADLS